MLISTSVFYPQLNYFLFVISLCRAFDMLTTAWLINMELWGSDYCREKYRLGPTVCLVLDYSGDKGEIVLSKCFSREIVPNCPANILTFSDTQRQLCHHQKYFSQKIFLKFYFQLRLDLWRVWLGELISRNEILVRESQ